MSAAVVRDRYCIHCFKTDEEPAGERCKNPSWHAQPQPPSPAKEEVMAEDD